MRKRILGSLLLVGLLHGCGTGGDNIQENAGNQITGTTASVEADLLTTNIDSTSFPWNNVADGVLKRWAYESKLIPVKINGSSEASYALDTIEATLGETLFDRTSIANSDDTSVTSGLIVSMGTAVGPGGVVDSTACGNVSSAAGSPSIEGSIIDGTGRIDAKLYVNIGSTGCSPRKDIAVHEIAHALGMGAHFTGYGVGSVIGGNFWSVLKTIYSNPVGTRPENLTVYTGVASSDSLLFTSAMLSGKTFTYSSGTNTAVVTFNPNGTATRTTGASAPWSIGNDGKLILASESYTLTNVSSEGVLSGTWSGNYEGVVEYGEFTLAPIQ